MARIHLRILGYLLTMFLHVSNLTAMQMTKNEALSSDIRIKMFRKMMYRYFTCWTVMLQILYAVFGLYCDVKVLTSTKKNYKLPGLLRSIRDILFASLVWPCSMVVFTVFWSLYLYDRNLIFPEFIDQVLSSTSNHILHTIIVPIVFWEVMCRPRVLPKSHLRNIVQLTLHLIVYLSVLYYTYISEGIWLYPVFHVTYGSFNFILLHISLALLFIIFYYMQWFINYIVHGSSESVTSKLK